MPGFGGVGAIPSPTCEVIEPSGMLRKFYKSSNLILCLTQESVKLLDRMVCCDKDVGLMFKVGVSPIANRGL